MHELRVLNKIFENILNSTEMLKGKETKNIQYNKSIN